MGLDHHHPRRRPSLSQSTLLPAPRTVAGACGALSHRPGLPFAEHLPAEQVHQAIRQAGGSFRERIFTPALTLWTFLSQALDADHSGRQAVARLLAWRSAVGLPPCSADNGAYGKARGRLPEGVLAELTRQAGRQQAAQAEGRWLWKGRPVQVVDGTGLSLPDTPANRQAYPPQRQGPAGAGCPLLRLVVVFSLAVGTAPDAARGAFKGKGNGELSLYRTLDALLEAGDVLLADRPYGDFWDVARARARGADVVVRPNAGRRAPVRFGRGHRANQRTWWRKPARPPWRSQQGYATYPEWLGLRAVRVRVRQRGFRTRRLVLVTTLRDAGAVTLEDLADLYRRRWQAELNLRSLKVALPMDLLRGQTPERVRQEVWAHLLVYNVVRALMAQAARAAGVRPDAVSFTGALQAVNAFLPNLRSARTAEEVARRCLALLGAIAQHRVGNRPDRYEPRAVRRRPKKFPRLTEPRAQARRRLREGASRSGD